MNRRRWLQTGLTVAVGARLCATASGRGAPGDQIMTVSGPIAADRLGTALVHEHILVDFIGAEKAAPDRYDRAEVARVALPHLHRIKAQGISALFECTPAYLARDPLLLQELAKASGLHLVTNTGYYAANGGKHLPAHARTESAEQLADRWIGEWREGIGGTGIRPGFIKIGLDAGALGDVGRKLIRAAALTHRATGLTIAAHTGDGQAAFEQLDLLEREGVQPAAWVWVHAQAERDRALHRRAAERGAWVEFDGIGPDSIGLHIELVNAMKQASLLHRVLISHDAGWYQVGEPGGGTFRPFDTLVASFLPALGDRGYRPEEIERLTVVNPREAFAIRPRVVP